MVKSKVKQRLETIGIIVSLLVLLFGFYGLINYLIKNYPIERTAKKWITADQEFYCTKLINDERGVSFVGYDCKSVNRITRGIKKCSGEYYIFIDKINGRWVINESSKVIMW